MEGKTISQIAKDATINELKGDELFLVVSDNTNKAVTTNTISEFCNKQESIILYVSDEESKKFNYYPVKITFGDIILNIDNYNLPYVLSDDIFNKIDAFIKQAPNIQIYTTDNILLYIAKNNTFKQEIYDKNDLKYYYGNYQSIIIIMHTTQQMLNIDLLLSWSIPM